MNSKTFRFISGTVSVLSLIVSVVQIIDFGVDFYEKKIQKPKKVAGFGAAAS